jgi:pimeloyl-ACP methyl ester carboxylesterase
MRRLIAGVVAGCATLAVTAVAPPVGAAASGGRGSAGVVASGPQIAWGTCPSATLTAAQVQCGRLQVPLDYRDPTGPQITLAVSRVRHTVPAGQFQGVMLVNPGGPGGSGLALATAGRRVPNNVGASYDWIGFDPRGVGASRPALSCLPNYFAGRRPQYVPVTDALRTIWLARAKGYAAACNRNSGTLLAHMSTIDSARDMDSIRQALGVQRINYYGFSYGTYLGAVYATLFPSRVRRMVLDSNVNPRDVWYQANLNQDVAFERNMRIWFSWLARYDNVYHLGRTAFDVERLFYQQENALWEHPAGGVVGPAEWNDAFLWAPYYQITWLALANVFASWVYQRDAAKVIAAYRAVDSPGNDNGYAVYSAVQCTDAQWPSQWSTWERDNWRVYRAAQFATWLNAWYNAPCLFWPAKAGTPVQVDGGPTAALLVDETLDAPTPYPGSIEVRRRFPRARLLAEPGGTTHAGTLSGNPCVDDTIAAYLATGALPTRRAGDQADALCPPLPQPVPTTAGNTVPSPRRQDAYPAPGARGSISRNMHDQQG